MDILRTNVTNNCNGSKCSNCGECCGEFLPITKKEYYIIKDYLLNHPEIVEQVHAEGGNVHLLCPFRDRENKCCTIYPVRPLVCRQFLCLKSLKTIEKAKLELHKRADFNHMDNVNGPMVNLVSFHALFFNDVFWEADVLFNMCEGNLNMFKALSQHTYFDYKDMINNMEDK